MLLMAKFYDLHLGRDRLAPAAALRAAQIWLRDTSGAALSDYVNMALNQAIRQGSIGPTNEVGSNMLADAAQFTDAYGEKTDAPFAHPYHWAGFTMTGQ